MVSSLSEFDHKKPHSKGGRTELNNSQITHKLCNRAKGEK
ncbi:MAG: HNH endonuclease [Thaumarchaeota archaeon]|nr:HNH endonuclease [Nitrososphaerota archaeon]